MANTVNFASVLTPSDGEPPTMWSLEPDGCACAILADNFPDANGLWLTPNDTIYVCASVNFGKAGVVVVIPTDMIAGLIDDFWRPRTPKTCSVS